MLVVEDPSELVEPLSFGSFVVIGIDIAASVRGLNDERVALTAALPSRKCLAWIFGDGKLEYSEALGRVKLNLWFQPVGRGLPQPPQSYAAVPVAPAPPHPETGRLPVEPSSPLPWPDCHIYTSRPIKATVSRIYQSSDPAPLLDRDRRRTVYTAFYEDSNTAAAVEDAEAEAAGVVFSEPPSMPIDLIFEPEYADEYLSSEATSSAASTGSLQSTPERKPQSRDDAHTTASKSDVVTAVLDGSIAAPPEIDSAIPGTQDKSEPECIQLHVELWSSVQPTDELGTVHEFLSTVDRLIEIDNEWWERRDTAMLANAAAPKATAWLHGISEAGPLELPHVDHAETNSNTQQDDDIGPDDAPEERRTSRSSAELRRPDNTTATGSIHSHDAHPLPVLKAPDLKSDDLRSDSPKVPEGSSPSVHPSVIDAELQPPAVAASLKPDLVNTPREYTLHDLEAANPPTSTTVKSENGHRISVISRILAVIRSLASRVRAIFARYLA